MNRPKKTNYNKKSYSNHHHTVKEQVQVIHPVKKSDKSSRTSNDWNLYLPDKSYEEFAHFSGKLKAVEKYFSEIKDALLDSVSSSHHFRINVADVSKDKAFLADWPEFMADLVNSPQTVIGLFGFAMHQVVKKREISEDDEGEDPAENEIIPKKLNPRFVGLQNYLRFQDLKMHNYGKLVTVIGTVVRVSDIKPLCLYIAFMCVKCKQVQVVIQNKGCYTTPNTCADNKCHCKVFKPLLSSHLTQTVPLKNISLQEMIRDNSEGGRIARTIECELTCDLTSSCMPGDTVIISGIVTTSISDEKKEIGRDVMSYILHISANSVVCLKGKSVDSVDLTLGYSELKSEDLRAIKHIHSQPHLFRLMVSSLAPNIYGHELIKAGLILALFGGRDRSKASTSECEFTIRDNSHVLIVGDPGLGKSQMLLACSSVSPRGVYVCGNSTTSSGLTVTISKGGNNENSLEAGALVLADQGHCCIDEFDKMIHQHSALLEAMEQQTISMAKSGVVCTLPARTSILAAANPSGGHYNRAKTVSENLKIGGSLLSRFDLVFIVQDEPDQEADNKMSKHMMGLHTLHRSETSEGTTSHYVSPENSFQGGKQLLKKLRPKPGEHINPIAPALIQKYISYARKFSQPKITPEVAKILQEFYIDLRKQHKLSCSTPITTRQLESLIRLTEARARVELRAHCTETDAEDVIEIMKYSMRETYSDEFGNIDFDRSIHGSGMSKSAQAKKLVNMMTKVAHTKADNGFSMGEIKELSAKLKISSDSFYAVFDSLNDQGFILKKGHDLYQLQTL